MDFKDYYKTLGVDKKATEKEIKSAYRKLAKENHPDVKKNDKDAEKKFREINEAYEVLSDAEKRQKYDQLGQYWNQPRGGPRGGGGGGGVQFDFGDLGDLFGGGGGGGSGFSSFFEHFFGGQMGGRGGRQQAQQQPDSEAEIEVTLEEAIAGSSRTLTLDRPQACPTCHGSGLIQNGICPTCRGQGQISNAQTLTVKIPAGVKEGSKIRLREHHLVLIIRLVKDPVYEVKGHDLYRDVGVPVYTAVLGGKVPIRTPRGQEIDLKIPARTQSGKQFRLGGQGLPRMKGEAPGDLYARVKLEIPSDLSSEELELIEQWKNLRNGN